MKSGLVQICESGVDIISTRRKILKNVIFQIDGSFLQYINVRHYRMIFLWNLFKFLKCKGKNYFFKNWKFVSIFTLELTFLVISIDVKETKYFSKIDNFIKFYLGAHIFGDILD